MKSVYTSRLSDDELRVHLERGDSVAFKGLPRAWKEIETQVERLGFGDRFVVSRAQRAPGGEEPDVVRVSPQKG